jgi:hypothetical protein
MKKFYDMLKRLSPKFKWNVSFGGAQKDEIAQQLVSLSSDRPRTRNSVKL